MTFATIIGLAIAIFIAIFVFPFFLQVVVGIIVLPFAMLAWLWDTATGKK